jgi:hypothetical protein
MVNENHFQFDRKSFFHFWKTIYSFKNRKSFSKIILFILARMFNIRLPESDSSRNPSGTKIRQWEYCQRRNPATSGHRRRMPADQIPIESCRNSAMVKNRPDLAKMAGIRPNLTKSSH